jgi:hypothetical protein
MFLTMSPEELISQAQKEHIERNNLIEAERLYLKAAKMGSGHAAHELGEVSHTIYYHSHSCFCDYGIAALRGLSLLS